MEVGPLHRLASVVEERKADALGTDTGAMQADVHFRVLAKRDQILFIESAHPLPSPLLDEEATEVRVRSDGEWAMVGQLAPLPAAHARHHASSAAIVGSRPAGERFVGFREYLYIIVGD